MTAGAPRLLLLVARRPWRVPPFRSQAGPPVSAAQIASFSFLRIFHYRSLDQLKLKHWQGGAAAAVSPLSRLRGRVGVGVPPQTPAQMDRVPPPAALYERHSRTFASVF